MVRMRMNKIRARTTSPRKGPWPPCRIDADVITGLTLSRCSGPHGPDPCDCRSSRRRLNSDPLTAYQKIATQLDRLRPHGPRGPVWWRFGRSQWQPITDALTDTGTEDEYDAREEQRRQERGAARALGQQHRREELGGLKAVWECPSCQADVEPDTEGLDGYRPTEGGLCPDCQHTRREEAQQSVTAEDMASTNGILARLKARAEGR